MVRNKKELVARVKNHLKTDKIFVLGIGEKAVRFVSEHMDEINIVGFLTDNISASETICVNNKEYSVTSLDAFEIGDGTFVIVATNNNEYSDIFLSSRGSSTFNDYIWSEWYDIFMNDKKVVLIEGNCQLVEAYYFLKSIKVVTENYSLMVYHSHLYKSRYSKLRWNYYLVMCDFFISNNYMTKLPTSHRVFEIPIDCKVIKAPRVFYDFLWPEVQKNRNSTYTYNELKVTEKSKISMQPHGPYDVGDKLVNEMIKSGKNDNEIIDALFNYRVCGDKNIIERMILFFDNLEKQEKECDIVYSPYLKENILVKSCFYDPIHMNTEMCWYVVSQILQILGLPDIKECDIENYDEFWMYLDHCTELPVYPEIARQLGLKWVNEQTEYRVTFYSGVRKMTFTEYYKSYIQAARVALKLHKLYDGLC